MRLDTIASVLCVPSFNFILDEREISLCIFVENPPGVLYYKVLTYIKRYRLFNGYVREKKTRRVKFKSWLFGKNVNPSLLLPVMCKIVQTRLFKLGRASTLRERKTKFKIGGVFLENL